MQDGFLKCSILYSILKNTYHLLVHLLSCINSEKLILNFKLNSKVVLLLILLNYFKLKQNIVNIFTSIC